MGRAYQILFLVIIPEIIAQLFTSNFCDVKSCRNPLEHTLCYYTENALGSGCSRLYITSQGLTDSQKNSILNQHNQYRQYVAQGYETRGYPGPQPPTSTNAMPNLIWDDQLARIAQTWVNQCPTRFNPHDKCRNVLRFKVNQNEGRIESNYADGASDPHEVLHEWYDEVALFDSRTVNSYVYDATVGHYAQLVWAETRTVGCGQLQWYNPIAHPDHRYVVLLVCNYGPGGNLPNHRIYPIAQAISPQTLTRYFYVRDTSNDTAVP